VEAIFERDETMSPAANGGYVEPEREPAPPQLSRLDAIEHQIADDEPAVEPEVITEQAEEIEAEIEQPEAAAQTALADQLGLDDPAAAKADEHPGVPKAMALIAEIKAMNSTMDITALVSRNEEAIQAMPDDWGVKVEVAADERKREIEVARTKEAAK
jgi:hypothetical protein